MGLEQGGGIVDVSAATVLTVSFVIQVKARAAILQSLSFLGFPLFYYYLPLNTFVWSHI